MYIQGDSKKSIPKVNLLSFSHFLSEFNKTTEIYSLNQYKQHTKKLESSDDPVWIHRICSR